jgi:hypothetical protein
LVAFPTSSRRRILSKNQLRRAKKIERRAESGPRIERPKRNENFRIELNPISSFGVGRRSRLNSPELEISSTFIRTLTMTLKDAFSNQYFSTKKKENFIC